MFIIRGYRKQDLCIYGRSVEIVLWENEFGSVEDIEDFMRSGANNCKDIREILGIVYLMEVQQYCVFGIFYVKVEVIGLGRVIMEVNFIFVFEVRDWYIGSKN